MRTFLLMVLVAAASAPQLAAARPFGVVIRDEGHADTQIWRLGPVRYLDCRDTVPGSECVESTVATVTPPTPPNHPSRVARIIGDSAMQAAGGAFPRGAVLYSAVGSSEGARSRLLNWLVATVEGGRTRAEARDIRVVEDTFGESALRTAAECASLPADPRLQLLRSKGVLYVNVAGNHKLNGVCDTRLKVLACDPSARNVVGLWDSVEEPNTTEFCPSSATQITTGSPLWIDSNIAPQRYYVGASIREGHWVTTNWFHDSLPIGGAGLGTSWAAPGVAGGHLALADVAPHRDLGELEIATLAQAENVTHTTSPAAGSQNLSIAAVDPEDFADARDGLCTSSGPVTHGWWFDRRNSGSGVHFLTTPGPQARVVFGWFTYAANGRPTWRTGDGAFTASGAISGTIYRRRGNDSMALPTGTFVINRCDPANLTLRWTLHSSGAFADTELGVQQGVESLQRFCFSGLSPLANGSCPGLPTPNEENITGAYHQTALPGAGFTVETQGNQVGLVHYFFDTNHQPVWGTALINTTGAHMYQAIPINVFTGQQVCQQCASDGTNREALVGNKTMNLNYARWMPKFGMWLPLGGAATVSIPTDATHWPHPLVNRPAPPDTEWIKLAP